MKLDTMYSSDPDAHNQILYSKLALLELSGWIEQGFDIILKNYMTAHISSPYIQYGEKAVINKNNSFKWDANVRTMFRNILGLKNLEYLEYYIENQLAGVSIMKSTFDTIIDERNKAAHTYTPIALTRNYASPSVSLNHFRILKPIIVEVENMVATL